MENEMQKEIHSACIFQDIRKDLWVAVSLAISFVMLLYIAATVLYHPNYTSSTTFVISDRHKVIDEPLDMDKMKPMTESFQSVMTNPVLKKRAAEDMGEEKFPGTVSVQIVPETNLITVSVHAKSPEKAFQGLKSIMECYPELGEKVLGDMVLDVFEAPAYPSEPDVNLRGGKIMALCFLCVFFGTVFLIGLYSFMKETVKSEKEVQTLLDTTLFGVLYHEKERAKNKGRGIHINDAFVSFEYKERIKKICTKLLYKLHTTNQKVVLVTSAAQGEGKSTVAINLAQALAQRSKKVLLIEGDLKNPGLAKRMNLLMGKKQDWCEGAVNHKSVEKLTIKQKGFGFGLLMCGHSSAHPAEILRQDEIKTFLRECRQKADIVVIDGSCVNKRPDLEFLAKEADVSLLVVKENMTEAKYINDAIDLLESYQCKPLGCILNDAVIRRNLLLSSYGYGYGYGYGDGYGKYAKSSTQKRNNSSVEE